MGSQYKPAEDCAHTKKRGPFSYSSCIKHNGSYSFIAWKYIFSTHKNFKKVPFFSTRIKKRDKSSGCFWYGVWHGTPNVFLIHILHTYMRRCQSSINKNPPSPLLSLFILISWDFVRILCVNISKSNPCSEKMLVFI